MNSARRMPHPSALGTCCSALRSASVASAAPATHTGATRSGFLAAVGVLVEQAVQAVCLEGHFWFCQHALFPGLNPDWPSTTCCQRCHQRQNRCEAVFSAQSPCRRTPAPNPNGLSPCNAALYLTHDPDLPHLIRQHANVEHRTFPAAGLKKKSVTSRFRIAFVSRVSMTTNILGI